MCIRAQAETERDTTASDRDARGEAEGHNAKDRARGGQGARGTESETREGGSREKRERGTK